MKLVSFFKIYLPGTASASGDRNPGSVDHKRRRRRFWQCFGIYSRFAGRFGGDFGRFRGYFSLGNRGRFGEEIPDFLQDSECPMFENGHLIRTIAAIAAKFNHRQVVNPTVFEYRGVALRIEQSAAGVYEVFTAAGFWLVRGSGGADYRLTRQFAERLIDWVAAGFELRYHPNGDIGVLIESNGEGRDQLIHSPPSLSLIASEPGIERPSSPTKTRSPLILAPPFHRRRLVPGGK
jgi:hypothetical protein